MLCMLRTSVRVRAGSVSSPRSIWRGQRFCHQIRGDDHVASVQIPAARTGVKTSAQKREEREAHNNKTLKMQRRAKLVTQAGALINLSLAACKSAVGFSIGSTALVGDAANSLGDIVCDAIVYYSMIQSRRSASLDRPWGHGKLESLGALCVGGLLLLTGAGVGFSAGTSAYAMTFGDAAVTAASAADLVLASVGSGTSTEVANPWMVDNPVAIFLQSTFLSQYGGEAAIAVSCISIACKETLFYYTLRIGRAIGSSSIMANAWQHRSDSFVSGAVLVGVTGSMLGCPILDPLAGLLVSGVIMKQGVETGMESLKDLSDAPAPPQETDELRMTCMSVPGIIKVNEIFGRQSGPYLYVETTVGVPGYISASAAHRLAELVKIELLENHRGRVANAVVHVEPLGATGLGEKAPEWARDENYVKEQIDLCVEKIPEITTVTEVQVYYKDDGHLVIKVDVSMNPELTIKQAHVTSVKLRELVEHALPGVSNVDVDLELDEGGDDDHLTSIVGNAGKESDIDSRQHGTKLTTKIGHTMTRPDFF